MTDFEVGDEAVVLWHRRDQSRATRVTVIRKGKRDLTLSDGSRFNASRLIRNVGGTWGAIELLVRPDDPQVSKVDEERKRERAINRVRVAYDMWQRNQSDPALSRGLAEAATMQADYLEAKIGNVAQNTDDDST